MFSQGVVSHLLHRYGYFAVGGVVGLESAGVPLPGESVVIAAALYASTSHRLSIYFVVAAAAGGAILGDNLGYAVGRWLGTRVLARHGPRIGLTPERQRLGEYLFRCHGGKMVFFGRFVALLRTFAALLAGASHMPWHDFFLWNALGGITWACLYGFGAYGLGKGIERIAGPVGIALGVVAGIALVAGFIFLRRNEARLIAEAQRAMEAEAGRR